MAGQSRCIRELLYDKATSTVPYKSVMSFIYEQMNPFMRTKPSPHDPLTSQRSHLSTLLHWESNFNMTFKKNEPY
jgi:hypothetical protein